MASVRGRHAGALRRGHAVANAKAGGLAVPRRHGPGAVRGTPCAGVGGDADRKVLRDYQRRIPEMPVTDAVWQEACDLADRCRRAAPRTARTSRAATESRGQYAQ
jgi:hypothetical protein